MWPAGGAIAVCCGADARGQANQRQPHIGYLYPAGGQRGCVVQIAVGGQYLRGATGVYVSGEGAHASVIKHCPPLRNLDAEQRRESKAK